MHQHQVSVQCGYNLNQEPHVGYIREERQLTPQCTLANHETKELTQLAGVCTSEAESPSKKAVLDLSTNTRSLYNVGITRSHG